MPEPTGSAQLQQDQLPGSWLWVTCMQRNSQAKAKTPESGWGRGLTSPLFKEGAGGGCVFQSGPQLLVAASRVCHMLLFSSLSPEAAWQQVPLAVFSACLPTDASAGWCHHPSNQGARKAEGQDTQMTSIPPPHQPGLSWAHHSACQEKIKENLLSTSGQQRAAPSLSSPFSTGPGAHSLICETATKYLPTTKY